MDKRLAWDLVNEGDTGGRQAPDFIAAMLLSAAAAPGAQPPGTGRVGAAGARNNPFGSRRDTRPRRTMGTNCPRGTREYPRPP
ncbi:hypothetical protein GCM10018775_22040 [Streptomyces umbrinus]|nr:hypothetical protein GCM10018775_22040 [Streptomyces umbrinus]